MKLDSLKKKTSLFIFIITVFCTASSSFMASKVVEKQMMDKYVADKEAATGVLSYSLAPMLNLYNYKQVEQLITSSLRYEQIASVAVFDVSGTLIRSAARRNVSVQDLDMERCDITTNMRGIIGSIEIDFSKEYINKQIRTMTLALIFGLMGIFLLVGLGLHVFMNRSIIEPLETFEETVKEMNSENLSARVKISGKDEIGVLAASFNQMAENLEKSHRALYESEERFRTIFNAVNDAIFVHDLDTGAILYVNSGMCEMYGYSREEACRLDVEALSLGESPYSQQEALIWIKKAKGEPQIFEWRAKRKSGDLFWVEVTMRRARIGDRNRLLVVIRDITKRRQAEEELAKHRDHLEELVETRTSELETAQEAMLNLVEDLNKSKDELEKRSLKLEEMNIKIQEASRLKSQFLANMSHELRTPLNAIIGFSEILEDKTFGELNVKQAKYVNNVLVSGRHLLQLINDILDLSKVEAGKLELEPSSVNIKHLLENSLIMIKEKAMKHGIRLDSHISQELMGLKISADERKLKQIMFNLLSNAAKFTPDGGEIRMTADLADSSSLIADRDKKIPSSHELIGPQKFLQISVADTGIGIKPEDQERIFSEFEQLDLSYDRTHEGTGLGLALTRRLVELHGGRIWVESEGEGKGSTFTFVIPVEAEERNRVVSSGQEEPLPSRPDVDDSRPLVLIVEDDHQASELISHYLSEGGYAAACAFDGKQAIQMARELKPYAITLDILLPGKGGWEVLAELKSMPETKDIPVVIVSIVENRLFGLNLGAIEYFVKPVNKEQLIEVMDNMMAKAGRVARAMTVLVVDDEPRTVEMLTDILRTEGFTVLQAYGGQEGIDLALEKHPDVIILDLMMPEVSGFDVVQQLRANSEAAEIPILIFTAKNLTEDDRQKLESHVRVIGSKSGSGKEDLMRMIERLGRIRKGKG